MILVPNEIFEDNKLSMYAKVCYVVIKSFTNKNNSCFPGRKIITEKGGFGITTYKKCINQLEEYGHITRTARYSYYNGYIRQTSNCFSARKINDYNGFFEVRNDLFDFGLSAREIAVYCYLCKCDAGKGCFPRQSDIARGCGISTRSVIGAVKSLEKCGILETYHTQFAQGANSVLYYVFTHITPVKQDKKTDKRVRCLRNINKTVKSKLYHMQDMIFAPIGKLQEYLERKCAFDMLNIYAMNFTTGGYVHRDRQ